MKIDYVKIQGGDCEAFKLFYDDFFPSLCFYASKIIDDDVAACDITQDAFIYFWERRSVIHSLDAAKSYLFKCVKNRALNYLRDNHFNSVINPEKLEISFYYSDFIILDEVYRMIHRAVEKLPPQGRRVIELTLDGLKTTEIAEKLNISINTVKTLKSRAFKSMRVELRLLFFLLDIKF